MGTNNSLYEDDSDDEENAARGGGGAFTFGNRKAPALAKTTASYGGTSSSPPPQPQPQPQANGARRPPPAANGKPKVKSYHDDSDVVSLTAIYQFEIIYSGTCL